MAKPGLTTAVRDAGSAGSADTRRALVEGAIVALREDGFAGASARAIAARAGCNQALVFYHFGSVANLLLAALDEISARRLAAYRDAVDGVTALPDLVAAAARLFREDLDAGYVTVLAQMIAGAATTPGLGPAVAERIKPWRKLVGTTVEGALERSPIGAAVPAASAAHAVMALYLGLELLEHLDGDRRAATRLFKHADQLAGLVEAVSSDGGRKR